MNTSSNSQGSCNVRGVTTEKVVRAFAGTVILLSLALGVAASPVFHSVYWLWLTAFVGANLLQSSFTGLCPLNTILTKVFHVRSVRLGASNDEYTEVISGVLPGEIIATAGSDVLKAQLLKNNLGAGCDCVAE